jgi:hypothetical protein
MCRLVFSKEDKPTIFDEKLKFHRLKRDVWKTECKLVLFQKTICLKIHSFFGVPLKHFEKMAPTQNKTRCNDAA